jgi:hypothetical protein
MVTVTSNRAPVIADKSAARVVAPLKAYQFKGKGAIVRNTALQGVASLAYMEGKSRADVIAQLRIVLGSKPTPADLAATALEYVVGRVAQKLADSSKPIVDQLAFARQLVTQYAAPSKDGVKAKALQRHQIGRRTPEQHKAVRAAEGAWYLVNGELGFGTAQTQGEKNKRQAASAGSTKRGKSTPPTHSMLVKGAVPAKNKTEACSMVFTLAASLLAYANKNAATLPTEYGLSIKRFHGAIAELEAARRAG